jgi:hypothetical protein
VNLGTHLLFNRAFRPETMLLSNICVVTRSPSFQKSLPMSLRSLLNSLCKYTLVSLLPLYLSNICCAQKYLSFRTVATPLVLLLLAPGVKYTTYKKQPTNIIKQCKSQYHENFTPITTITIQTIALFENT